MAMIPTVRRLALGIGLSNFGSRGRGTMGKARERQIILKKDKRTIFLEMGLGGKFQAKSSGWDENRTFLEGDVLEVEVRNGRWVLTAD